MAAIPSIADAAAYQANIQAIDRVVRETRYRSVVAWGKWLGFTPETVQSMVEEAERDNAPQDAIQKIDGRWMRRNDIANDENRRRVEELALNP